MKTAENTMPEGEPRTTLPVPSLSRLRNLLRSEPDIWAQHDERNRWFCPHCGEIVSRIVIPADNPFLLLQDCPLLILEHLKLCQAVQAGMAAEKHYTLSASRSGEMKSALHKARMSQRQMLRPPPVLPGYEFACLYRPMNALAGDFYDFVNLPSGRLGLAVGDPSGHGVEACMLMAVTKKLISMYGRSGLAPADCLNAVNCELYEDVSKSSFISALYGVLDPVERRFTYARAGQNPAMIYNPARTPKLEELQCGGIALGVDPGANFQAQIQDASVQLIEGDTVLLYTDGMTEINTPSGEELGVEGLAAIVEKFSDRDLDDMLNQVWYSLEKLFRNTGQQDDMTMLVMRVLPRF